VGPRCSFCGATAGPFLQVEGAFRLLMCGDCQAARGAGGAADPATLAATGDPDAPVELLAHPDLGEPWYAWGCPIDGCGYRVVLPWWLVGHTAAEHPGWTAAWVAERMRVVYRRADP
jgi:hypothetical protein